MVDAEDGPPVIVIDNGSGMMKAGLAGDEGPSAVFTSLVGRPKMASAMLGVSNKTEFIGEEAQQKRGVLNLNYPIANGIVNDWDDMEKVWQHTFFNELRVKPDEHPGVLLTEAPRNPKENRKQMAQRMFETFNVNGLYIAIQAVMSLYANGRNTGLVVDSGDGVTHTVPVFEGYCIKSAVEKMQIAGREITNYCQKQLLELGHTFTSSAEMEIVKDIKEKLCYVSQDYATDYESNSQSSVENKTYTLPDNAVIEVPGTFRITVPELLFQPTLNGLSCKSMQDLSWASVAGSDIDIRKDLLKNVILSGGTTMYDGLADRLKKELQTLAPAGNEIKLIATTDRKYAVFKGASTLACLSTFNDMMLTKEEYFENGDASIDRKFGA